MGLNEYMGCGVSPMMTSSPSTTQRERKRERKEEYGRLYGHIDDDHPSPFGKDNEKKEKEEETHGGKGRLRIMKREKGKWWEAVVPAFYVIMVCKCWVSR